MDGPFVVVLGLGRGDEHRRGPLLANQRHGCLHTRVNGMCPANPAAGFLYASVIGTVTGAASRNSIPSPIFDVWQERNPIVSAEALVWEEELRVMAIGTAPSRFRPTSWAARILACLTRGPSTLLPRENAA